jgi:hypothetical protein
MFDEVCFNFIFFFCTKMDLFLDHTAQIKIYLADFLFLCKATLLY